MAAAVIGYLDQCLRDDPEVGRGNVAATTRTSQRLAGFSRQVECLRRRLSEWGWSTDEIAVALGAQFRLRPRAAYRYAAGLSGQKAADAYNARFGTADRPAPMSKTRISEYENWPIGRNTRKPSLMVLDNLAQLYGTTRRLLTDHHDWMALPDSVRRALHTSPESGPQPVRDSPLTQEDPGVSPPCIHASGRRPSGPFVWVSPGAWTAQAEGHVIMAAANQAGDHAGWSGAGDIDEATLEQLHDHVARLARGYLTGPMIPLFGELVAARNRAYELLERTQRLSQRRELYLVVGQLSCLLAGTSCDLGYPQAAIEQARAACTYGDLIGHNSLWAYAHGQLAMFFSLEGQLRRSLRHARLGQLRAAPGSPALRLRSLEALACSRLSLVREADAALAAAGEAREHSRGDDDLHDRTGGMFTSTPAKHAYLAAMTHIHLGLMASNDTSRIGGMSAASKPNGSAHASRTSAPPQHWIGFPTDDQPPSNAFRTSSQSVVRRAPADTADRWSPRRSRLA
ncbi:MAG: hypothetical protein ACRDRA_21075 [Pseudonocardiaceae bacterium]